MKKKAHFTVYASTPTSKRRIVAAEEEDTRVKDMMDTLNDDFDFALDGFSKLVRNGNVAEALSIMTTLNEAINVAIHDTADMIS